MKTKNSTAGDLIKKFSKFESLGRRVKLKNPKKFQDYTSAHNEYDPGPGEVVLVLDKTELIMFDKPIPGKENAPPKGLTSMSKNISNPDVKAFIDFYKSSRYKNRFDRIDEIEKDALVDE